nr:hypothetical protein [Hyphomonas sp. 34-62-18]
MGNFAFGILIGGRAFQEDLPGMEEPPDIQESKGQGEGNRAAPQPDNDQWNVCRADPDGEKTSPLKTSATGANASSSENIVSPVKVWGQSLGRGPGSARSA